LPDIISVDMNPEDNFRKKKNMGSNNYFIYQIMILQDQNLQYVRNTLQLNQGLAPVWGDTVIHPVFSDIGFLAGVAETDWSWAPLIADMDNDGNKDIFITNGYPRDVTDHDFMAFKDRNISSKKQLIDQMPQIKVSNYAFRNMGNLKFENNAEKWGMSQTSFSNGAVYVDLDNDGDLDFVVNNISDPAFVYRNSMNNSGTATANYLEIMFKGENKNQFGIGAEARIFYDGDRQQVIENSPYRGYLSTVDTEIHFGLGNTKMIDSVIIRWPGNKRQKFFSVAVNQLLIADIKNAQKDDSLEAQPKMNINLFTEVTSILGINFVHQASEYIDFNYERLLPHKLSQYGPGLAAGDVDLNGLDDIVIGGTDLATGKLLLQQTNGEFIQKDLPVDTTSGAVRSETMGILLFDADGDGDLDLYFTSGSNRFQANSKSYQDKFYENDGKGNFKLKENAIPTNYVSKSCIKAVDFDNDGDLDLFVGGRILPEKYPQKVSSFIYRNDSKDEKVKFTDVSDQVAPELKNIGLVCDAIWTDFDHDGFTDLIVVGEWMPVTFFKNIEGKFSNTTAASGIADKIGWWNSITAGDFDNNGDVDYIVGNLGQNSFYRPTDQYPVKIYVNDFDNNGILDAIPTVFLKHTDGTIREFTAHNRDDIVGQLPVLKKNFLTYKSFANADINTLLGKEWLNDAVVSKANWFQTSVIKNIGKNNFTISPLPPLAQLAPVYGMITDDFNDDGNLDVALNGNDYGGEVSTGRYDAMKGLVMLGDGKGNFIPQSISQSGLYIPGDGKAIIKLRGINNELLVAASQNKGPLKVFKVKNILQKQFKMNADDRVLYITLTNGSVRKEEIYYGSSFLSQSSGCISVGSIISKISVINNKKSERILYKK
ncbi:MAG: VCBS repeat-containing protein, partial [Bacteroidota bacterium]|nr:VCBS repeat-containing protein [Bacteroidota bacterium]